MTDYNKIFVGVVKDNEDFQNMGRLGVFIPELSNIDSPIVVSYASPFYGASNPEDIDHNDTQTFEGTQTSYGFWATPPSLNALVLVMFANAEPSRGYWIACIQQQYMNHMLPNIPVGDSYQYGKNTPVAEYNKSDSTPNKHKGKRPYHKVHYEAIRNQGLKHDKIRGFSQHGATSKRPSSVMGMLSPKGHYWSMEDTEGDEKIRLRTKSGVQLLLDDTNGLVYVVNKNGTGWVEVGAEGKIMVYGEEGIALRTKQDFTVRADRDIIMESGRNMYLHGMGNIYTETNNFLNRTYSKYAIFSDDDISLAGEGLHVDMSGAANFVIGEDFNLGSSSNINLNSSGNLAASGTNIDINASTNLTLSGSAAASLSGQASLGLFSGGTTTLDGATIMQNMGGSFVGAAAASPANAQVVEPDPFELFDKSDVEQPTSDDEANVSTLPTLVTTLPTHEPCSEHDTPPENLG